MKKLTTITSIAALVTLASASAFASSAHYDVKILDLNNVAQVTVTQDGQPVEGAKVTLTGLSAQSFKTSEGGTVELTNSTNASRSFTISVEQPDGSVTSEQRFISAIQ